MKEKIIVISGPTASGKSDLAYYIAKKIDGVVINADSMQVYKGLPILSAQPSSDVLNSVKHLLYSYVDPVNNFSAGKWLENSTLFIKNTIKEKKVPIVVGGTGMYIDKLMNGISNIPDVSDENRKKAENIYDEYGKEKFYDMVNKIDPEAVLKVNINDKRRLTRVYEIFLETGKKLSYFRSESLIKFFPKEDFFVINLKPARDILYKRCNDRFNYMFNNGILSEVSDFIKKYPKIYKNQDEYLITKTLGFKEVVLYLDNKLTKDRVIELSVQKTKNYAKRQFTWFNNQLDNKNITVEEAISKDNIENIANNIVSNFV